MISVMPLTADHITAVCQIDSAEQPSVLEAMMAKPAFAGLGIKGGGQWKGFVYGWCFDGHGEIVQITIAQDNRRQGYGRVLMRSFLDHYDLASCWLELRADNMAAFSLYQSIGFVEDGRRKGYYQSATDDGARSSAILMQWNRTNNITETVG